MSSDAQEEARLLVHGRIEANPDLVALHQHDPQFHADVAHLEHEVLALLDVVRARHPYSEVAAITTAYVQRRLDDAAKSARDMQRIRDQLAARAAGRLMSEFT